MKILSHRGWWQNENEKNTILAFQRSFQNSFGTEMDIRDYGGGGNYLKNNLMGLKTKQLFVKQEFLFYVNVY